MYIIDGHNLIPKLSGLSLADLDDEEKLIERLQVFARVKRARVEVFFDDAPPGQAGMRKYGAIRAHFVPIASEADQAIRAYLDQLGKNASRWTVVSSDRRVQADARECGAKRVTSDVFAVLLEQTLAENAPPPTPKEPPKEPEKNTDPLNEWYEVFNLDPDQAAAPLDISARPKRDKPKAPKKPAGKGAGGNTDEQNSRKYHGFDQKK